MKRIVILLAVLLIVALAACGGNDEAADEAEIASDETEAEVVTLKIGASSIPHAEILEEAKSALEEEGIELEIEPYEDYVLPNDDLASGELDANYFQHIPYLDQTVEDTGYELTHIGGIHIEPMGVYSKEITDIETIEDGTEAALKSKNSS